MYGWAQTAGVTGVCEHRLLRICAQFTRRSRFCQHGKPKSRESRWESKRSGGSRWGGGSEFRVSFLGSCAFF